MLANNFENGTQQISWVKTRKISFLCPENSDWVFQISTLMSTVRKEVHCTRNLYKEIREMKEKVDT